MRLTGHTRSPTSRADSLLARSAAVVALVDLDDVPTRRTHDHAAAPRPLLMTGHDTRAGSDGILDERLQPGDVDPGNVLPPARRSGASAMLSPA